MIQLYDLNHVKLYGLTNYKELKRERFLDGDEILSFFYPQADFKYNAIQEECYIRTKDNEYTVKEVNIDDDWTEFICKVNVENLKGNPFSHFESVEQNCTNAVNLTLAGTGWTIGTCDVIKLRTVRKSNCSSYDILQEIRKVYRCDFRFDAINKKVYIYSSMGADKGTYFTEELNLKKLDTQSNSYDYCTRIIPVGKDGLSIKDINGGKDYVENYQYSNKIITVYWEDNRYTVIQSLKDDAIARLNELSKPRKSYKADIFDLARLSDKYTNILDYGLGDTITLLSKNKQVKDKQRIVKVTEYPEEPERNTCEIANRIMTLEELQTEFIEATDTVNAVTTSDGMIDNSKVDFNPIRQEFDQVIINKADINSLNAVVARVGTLEATSATITQLNAQIAKIDDLKANKADIKDLNATNAKITTLESSTASINNLLAGNLSAANMQAGFITAESGLIANGAISSAQIISLDVSKINAGNISTNKFTVQSDSGNLKIQDNTLKVWDKAGKERVSLGLNGSDYNLLVRGADGNTVLFGTDGVTKAGITTGAVDDSKIATNANINGSKIEKESLVTQINGATTLLKATKVKLDSENQTLDVAFTSLKSTVTSQGSTITSQGTSISTIQGQISSKIWQQDINTTIDPVSGKVTTLENNYSGLNQTLNGISLNVSSLQTATANLGTRITAAEGSISVLQGQIALKVTQADIDNSINAIQVGGRNLFKGYGDKEIRLTDYQSTGSFSQFVNSFSFDPSEYVGSIFTISFWAKSPNGTTPIQVYNNNGSPRYFYFLTTLDMSLGTEWKYYTYTFTNTDRGSSYTPSNKIEIYAQSKTGVVVKKIKLELGNKATDWTPAPEDIDGAVSALTSRISTAELKITPTEIVNSINTTDGVGKVKSVNVTIDSTGLTVANGKIIIKNNAGQSVLSADTSGNLSIQGELKGYNNGNLATHILRESIRFYNWDVPGQELGYIAGTFNPQNTSVKGLSLASSNGKYVYVGSGSGSVTVNNGYNPNGYTEPIVLSGNINFSNYNLVRVGDINYGSTSATRIYNLTLYDNEVDTNKSSLALWLNYSGPAGGCSTYIGDGRGNFGYLKAGSLTITGSKNCVQKTKNYGNLLINAYETAEYYFGDIGTGRLENGECIVWIDEIFKDCINTDIQYQVFLSKYGIGDIWVAERQKDYFIVKGAEDIDFAWELKAKRKGYENDRLERESNEAEKENKPDHEQRYALTTIEEEAKKTMVTIDTLNAFAFEETQWLDESTSLVVDDLLDLNQYYKDLEV